MVRTLRWMGHWNNALNEKDAARTGRFRNARCIRCRCFLPDLTGFTGLHRAGPDPGDTWVRRHNRRRKSNRERDYSGLAPLALRAVLALLRRSTLGKIVPPSLRSGVQCFPHCRTREGSHALSLTFFNQKLCRTACYLTLFKLAEREGFEPSVHFRAHTLSRRAPSTTQTSLQSNNIRPKPEAAHSTVCPRLRQAAGNQRVGST